ncbi:MAG: hypothetical protein IKI37_03595 [Oscillospiraceae bacterium]|nr:hypothetical protein [Oscillospiraceae bacterium]
MAMRKFPYGYRMEKGKIIICEPETEIIRAIFRGRAGGRSNWEMAVELFNSHTAYFDADVKKASCKISDILYNERYIGAEGYEAIVDREVFEAVQKLKGKKWVETSVQRPVAGRTAGDIAPKKAQIISTVCIPDKAVFDKEKSLKTELRSEDADIEKIRNMIIELASMKYDCIA